MGSQIVPSIIPLTDDAAQTENILGLTLFFYWNVRDNSWRMTISKDDTVIISGVKLVVGILLLRAYALNIGDFFVFENSTSFIDPTRHGFTSAQFELVYLTQEEANEFYSAS